jgi:SNF2 family DNA or RNA helicase
VFIVADALAANNTWEICMADYGIPFFRVNTRADALGIPAGRIVLITLGMAAKFRKLLKRHIRMCSRKAMLVFDESDSITSPFSGRTKAMLDIFRRCRIKYLTTGTTTRNNITEIAPQMELIYNNSINYISWARYIYVTDKDGAEHEFFNEYYGKPVPAYRDGYRLFSQSHLPHRITVFGVEQFTQDVYNAGVLRDLLGKTVITRTFEEVAGRKIYEINQIMVPFHTAEKAVYLKAVKEFNKMRWKYFRSLGNSRKDSMFRILQQLVLLLKICADPASIGEYDSPLEASKAVILLECLKAWENERVAIGVRHVDVAHAYAGYIRGEFPGRPVFTITGGSAGFRRRREVVKELEGTRNGILISTQQAYSKSQNIDFVDKILLPELHYNNAAMSQYYFRFIRYTSVNFKKVYFLTYENSIESNLLRMIMAKEKLNLFMKNQDVDDDDLFERFGVDRNIVNMLMTREPDEDGNMTIRWGDQSIV